MTEHEEMAEQIAARLAVRLAAGSGNRHAGRGSVRTGMDARQPTKAVCAAGGDEERGLAGRAAAGGDAGHRDIRSLQTCYNETAESMARLL